MLANRKIKQFSLTLVIFTLAFLMSQCRFPGVRIAPTQPALQETIFLPTETPMNQPGVEDKSTPTTLPLIESTSLEGKIVFVSDRDSNDEIYTMNADGSQQTRLTHTPSIIESWPVWSPDGQYIAFGVYENENYEIYKMNADGTEERRLTNNLAFDGSPAWSPDGKQIAFVSDRDGNSEIYIMNADGSEKRRLTNHPAQDGGPNWSPDGQYIAFSSTRGNPEDVVFVDSNLFMIDVKSGELTTLTDNTSSNTNPVWSPDGQYIAFVSDRDSVRGRTSKLYLLDVATKQVRRLTDDDMSAYPVPAEFAPTWSPDGQHIALTIEEVNDLQIYVAPIDSGQLLPLTNAMAKNFRPSWRAP